MLPSPPILLLSDVVDSTRLTARLGDVGMAALWARHDALVRAELARHGGYEHERTDGFLLSLPAVEPALALASALHAGLRALSDELGLCVQSRVVLHRGPVARVETAARAGGTGARLEGPGRARCEALLALCPGGSTLLSAEAAAGATGLDDLGWWALPALPRPVHLFARGPAPTPGPAGHPAPAPQTSTLLGRERELSELHAALQDGARLLTLLGPGGIGKTRLAREVCENTQIACFVSLAGARGSEATVGAAAAALGVPLGGGRAADQLLHALHERGRLLLVLDNAEPVVAEVASLARAWLQGCPELRVLVTSRERLGVPGERVFALEPLSPEASRALFEARAGAGLSPLDTARLPGLLDALGGLPLGLELAAAWTGRLSVDDLVRAMHDQDLADLSRGLRSLAATFEASWPLLEPEERESFLRLSVFEGELTDELLEEALGLDGLDRASTLADRALLQVRPGSGRLLMLPPLRDFGRNRLAREPSLEEDALRTHATLFARLGEQPHLDALDGPRGGELRAALVDRAADLHAAVERASSRGRGALAARSALAIWALRRAQGPVEDGLLALERALATPGLSTEDRQDLRIALAEALELAGRTPEAGELLRAGLAEGPQARIQAALGVNLSVTGRNAEALVELGAALERWPSGAPRWERARAEQERSHALERSGREAEGLEMLQSALRWAQEGEDHASEASLELRRSHLLEARGALAEAANAAARAQRRFEDLGDPRGVLRTTRAQALIAQAGGDLHRAAALLEEATAGATRIGDLQLAALNASSLGSVWLGLGDPTRAGATLARALRLARCGNLRSLIGSNLNNLGLVALLEGRLDEADQHLRAAREALAPTANARSLAANSAFQGRLALARGAWREAREHLEHARSTLRDPQSQGFLGALLGQALASGGDVVGGLALLDESLSTLRASSDTLNLAFALAVQARVLAEAGLSADKPLAEAEALAATLGLAPRSQVGIAIAEARAALVRP